MAQRVRITVRSLTSNQYNHVRYERLPDDWEDMYPWQRDEYLRYLQEAAKRELFNDIEFGAEVVDE